MKLHEIKVGQYLVHTSEHQHLRFLVKVERGNIHPTLVPVVCWNDFKEQFYYGNNIEVPPSLYNTFDKNRFVLTKLNDCMRPDLLVRFMNACYNY